MGRITMSSDNRSRICKGCWQRMRVPIPLGGVMAIPFRGFGIRRSRMNPNLCTICELMFSKVMKARNVTIDATVMFADMRAYTSLSETLSPDQMAGLLDIFYDECATAIWEYDGLLNKTVGDAVMAVFNFPIGQADHASRAVLAAREIQRRCRAKKPELATLFGTSVGEFGIGIGIGIDSGMLRFGEFGRSHRDVTAIGTVVNTASRAQSVAAAGEILVTEAVYRSAQAELPESRSREHLLKGLDTPLALYTA